MADYFAMNHDELDVYKRQDAEQCRSGFDLGQARVGRRNAQMRVIGILVVGVGRAGTRQGQAAVLAQLGYALGAAGHDVQADEVTALRVRPVGDVAAGGQLLGKGGFDGVKATFAEEDVYKRQL